MSSKFNPFTGTLDMVGEASGAALTPASSVVDETSYGQSSLVGTSLNYARQDHTHGTVPAPTISDATLTTSDITTNNFTTSKHGFVPKGTNAGNFLKDDGTWATPSVGFSVIDSIADADATNAPSRNSVFDALLLKESIANRGKILSLNLNTLFV